MAEERPNRLGRGLSALLGYDETEGATGPGAPDLGPAARTVPSPN